jgi:hypothetical protein
MWGRINCWHSWKWVDFVLSSTCLSWYTDLFILVHQLFKPQRPTSLLSIYYFRTNLLGDANIFYPFRLLHEGKWCLQLGFLGSGLMSCTLLARRQSCTNLWRIVPPPINLFGFYGSSQWQEGSVRSSKRPFGGLKFFLMKHGRWSLLLECNC